MEILSSQEIFTEKCSFFKLNDKTLILSEAPREIAARLLQACKSCHLSSSEWNNLDPSPGDGWSEWRLLSVAKTTNTAGYHSAEKLRTWSLLYAVFISEAHTRTYAHPWR